jgi:hypothetical protein
VRLYGQINSMQRTFIGRCFLLTEEVFARKAVHNWVEKPGKRFADEEVETEVRRWLRGVSKNFYAVRFDALVNRWDKYSIVGGGYVEKYIFFSRVLYHMFYFLYPFVSCLLTLPSI